MRKRDPERFYENSTGGRIASSVVLERIVSAGGLAKSFAVAARLLKLIGEIDVSDRQINHLTVLVGEELEASRNQQTENYCEQWRGDPPSPRSPLERRRPAPHSHPQPPWQPLRQETKKINTSGCRLKNISVPALRKDRVRALTSEARAEKPGLVLKVC